MKVPIAAMLVGRSRGALFGGRGGKISGFCPDASNGSSGGWGMRSGGLGNLSQARPSGCRKRLPRPDQEETEAADRALNDPTLRQGDVVATTKGFGVFVGKDEEHQPTDFRPASGPQNSP
jgi:hypothetical protein